MSECFQPWHAHAYAPLLLPLLLLLLLLQHRITQAAAALLLSVERRMPCASRREATPHGMLL